MGWLGVPDSYFDAFCGRVPRIFKPYGFKIQNQSKIEKH
jgi:hypothetical protein